VDEKGLYELKTDIANLKKLHEQLESLHRQQIEKINQTKTNVSLTEKDLPGKVHECTSLYAQGIRNLREEFPKKAQSIETKIAAHFDAAYFKELEVDQKIIALESKTSPYTLIDQTVAVLGLVREAQKYSLLNEITEGDYTDLLNLYRIALRNNNRTTLAFIEGRLEKLTREPGKNREDEAAKNALFALVRRSVAKRLDPKVGELRDLFDTVINEHNCLIKDMDKDIKKPEVPQEQTGHETIQCIDGTEPFEGKREDHDNSAKLLMETPGEQQPPPLELLEQHPGPPPEPSDEQQTLPLEPLEQQTDLPIKPPGEHADLPIEPLEQPSGLVMEAPVEALQPTAETREDREDAAESLTEPPNEKIEDLGDLLLQAWTQALDKRPGSPAEGPEQQANPLLEDMQAHSGPPLEHAGQQEGPPSEQAKEHAGPPLEHAQQQEGPALESLEEHTDLPLEPLEQPSGLVMEAPVEASAETREDREDAAESLMEPPDEKIEDLGDLLLQAWTQALDKRPVSPMEGPEQQADPLLKDMQAHSGPPLEHAEEHAGPPLEHEGQQEGPPLKLLVQQTELPLDPLDEQPEIAMEPPAEVLQPSAETREDPEDASKSLKEPPDEKKEDPGKILIRAWMETLGQQPDAPLENPEEQPVPPLEQLEQKADLQLEDMGALSDPSLEPLEQQADFPPPEPLDEQPEIAMEPPAEVLQPSAETREDQKDTSETLVESPDENIDDLGKILVQEWMKNLEHKTETPSEAPEEQTEITMKASEGALKSTEEMVEGRDDAAEPPMKPPDENVEDLGKILVQEWMKLLDQKPATSWTLPEEQAEQPPGIPADELPLWEEEKEGIEHGIETQPETALETMESLIEKKGPAVEFPEEKAHTPWETDTTRKIETMDVSKALERIQSIERTQALGKIRPMDLTDALERITILENLWSLKKIHALPAETKIPKKNIQKKRKKSKKKKGSRKKSKK